MPKPEPFFLFGKPVGWRVIYLNMKNALSLLALLMLGSALSQAQIAFSNADMPNVNTVIEVATLDSAGTAAVNLGTAGANQSWNFSGLSVYPYSDFTYYLAAAQAPKANLYPAANLASAYELSDTAEYTYMQLNSSEFSQLGVADPTNEITFDAPAKIFQFPFTYQTAFTQNVGITGSSDGFPLSGTWSTNVVADAYGNVTTPLGTFPCLRVKRITEISATVFIFTFIQRDTSWEWITKQYKAPVFRFNRSFSSIVGQEENFDYAELLVAQTVADKEPALLPASLDLELAPNPTGGNTSMRFNLPSSGKTEALVFDTGGKIVRQVDLGALMHGKQTVPLDLANLPSGSYYVMLRQNGKVLAIRQLARM